MKYTFDRFDMLKLGLFFETKSELELFVDVITEEFEISIGEAVSAYVDEDTRRIFDEDESYDEFEKWALENPEKCDSIISSCREKLCNEIIQYKDEIPGLRKMDMEEFRNLDIDYFDADLSIRTNNIMRRNNIKNVGMILDYDDIKDIPKLGSRCAEELLNVLFGFC